MCPVISHRGYIRLNFLLQDLFWYSLFSCIPRCPSSPDAGISPSSHSWPMTILPHPFTKTLQFVPLKEKFEDKFVGRLNPLITENYLCKTSSKHWLDFPAKTRMWDGAAQSLKSLNTHIFSWGQQTVDLKGRYCDFCPRNLNYEWSLPRF